MNRFHDSTPLHYIVGFLFLLAIVLVFAFAWWQARKFRIAHGLPRWAFIDWLRWQDWRRLYIEELTRFGVDEIDARAWAEKRRFSYPQTSHLLAAKVDYELNRREPVR